MNIAMAHPTREELSECALGSAPERELVRRVRQHLEVERCSACSATTFDLLSGDTARVRRSPLMSRWLRPTRVGARAGTRVGAAADYQLVCAAGPFTLDVLVRDCEVQRELRYVGQVTHAGRIHEPVASLPLRLVGLPVPASDDTTTDEFGEFTFASARDGVYALRLGAAFDAPCVMVWEGWDA